MADESSWHEWDNIASSLTMGTPIHFSQSVLSDSSLKWFDSFESPFQSVSRNPTAEFCIFVFVVRNILLKYCYLIYNLGYILYFSVFFLSCNIYHTVVFLLLPLMWKKGENNVMASTCHTQYSRLHQFKRIRGPTQKNNSFANRSPLRCEPSVNYAFGLTRESDAQRRGQRTRQICIKGRWSSVKRFIIAALCRHVWLI